MNEVKSIYIHIPFCKNICSYCDFCKMYYEKSNVELYLKSLGKEISKNYKLEKINTIYIGGGTPSVLNIKELEQLFNIIKNIKLNNEYEFTFECNIEDITKDKLELLKNNRVNRLSIGVQTFNDELLKYLNRKTNKKQIISNIKLAKKYFDNISIDLIYSIPKQTIKNIKYDINQIKKLRINHIALYSLIIEPHTKLYIDKIKTDDDFDFKLYKLIQKKLKKYNHYEFSNYSKKGYESKHNLTYWNNKEYYGFGLGASGFINNTRYDNTKNINEYNRSYYIKTKEKQTIENNISNELILGLRKTEGINIIDFKNKYDKNLIELYNIKELINKKQLINKNNKLYINPKYLYVSNEILLNFI